MRICISCWRPVVAGRSRCSLHGLPNPARHGSNPYGYAHQKARASWIGKPKTCGICGGRILPGEKWHLDHVLPISLGGGNSPTQPAHVRCNVLKGGKNRLAWPKPA